MKNYPKFCISSTLEPKGGIYSHQRRGGQETGPGPKRGRGRGHTRAARGALRAARGPVCPLSSLVPGFVFAAPDFHRISSLGQ